VIILKVRATREIPLALDGINVRVFRAGEEFAAPEHVVRGQIGLGALVRADIAPDPEPAPEPEPEPAPDPSPGTYEAKPAPYEAAVQRPRRGRK
jgi:hypothetical protein